MLIVHSSLLNPKCSDSPFEAPCLVNIFLYLQSFRRCVTLIRSSLTITLPIISRSLSSLPCYCLTDYAVSKFNTFSSPMKPIVQSVRKLGKLVVRGVVESVAFCCDALIVLVLAPPCPAPLTFLPPSLPPFTFTSFSLSSYMSSLICFLPFSSTYSSSSVLLCTILFTSFSSLTLFYILCPSLIHILLFFLLRLVPQPSLPTDVSCHHSLSAVHGSPLFPFHFPAPLPFTPLPDPPFPSPPFAPTPYSPPSLHFIHIAVFSTPFIISTAPPPPPTAFLQFLSSPPALQPFI